MERVGRAWLVLLLCCGATSLTAGVGGGQGTRSNALGVDNVKSYRGRGGDKAVVGDPPPPSLPAPSSDEPQGPQHLPGHLPGRSRPSTTEGTRRRYHHHHHLLLPRLTKETPPLSQPTATDWLQAPSSGPAGSSRAPLLRRRQRRSSPAVVPPKGLYTEPLATPSQSPSAPATHKSSSQDDDHSQTSNAPSPPPPQQSSVSIPRIVSNILELLPNLLESGLHIPASVSPASRPRGSLSGQRHNARPTSHSVDEGISSTQRRRFTPLPPASWVPAAPPAPPPLSQPIHITINIAAGALAPTPHGSLGPAPTPQESLGLPRPPSPPATLTRGPLQPSGLRTQFDDEEGIPAQFPPATEPPKRGRPHITILPVRYPSQEAPPLPSPFSPSDRPSPPPPETSIITTRLGTQIPTSQLLTAISPGDAITFPGDPSPSPPFTKPQPPPANDTGSSQAPRDSEPPSQQIFFVLPDPELLTFPTPDGQRLPTDLTDSVRIIVVVPFRDCPEVCEVRNIDTMGCEVDEACLANLRADMAI